MSTERSDKVHETWRQSSEKFDYFVLGITGALCAYITQTFKFMKLGVTPNSLEFIAFLLLCLAAFAGFRRIEATVAVYRTNHILLRGGEKHGELTDNLSISTKPLINRATGEVIPRDVARANILAIRQTEPELRELAERQATSAGRWYTVRNWLLVAGFCALLSAKVWAAYV
jgi:hypothetical protein